MHEQEIASLRREVQELKDMVKPMAETYAAASKFGKWALGFFTFVSIIIGMALAAKELFKK